jgi:hypothetical protein
MPAADLSPEARLGIVGACLGAAHERSTTVLVERNEVLHRKEVEDFDAAARRWRTTTTFRLKEIRRLALGATPPDLASLITALSLDAEIAVVDISRVGISFLTDLTNARKIVPIIPYDQPRLSRRRGMIYVPERELGGVVVTALKQERLTFDPGVSDADTLLRALVEFTPEKPGADADVATAVAAAVWGGEVLLRSQVHQPPPPRLAPEPPRGPTFDELVKRNRQRGEPKGRI